jgi:hypothetical protein
MMKQSKHLSYRILTSLIVAGTLLLSGCGGSSGDSDDIPAGPSYTGPQTSATVDTDNQQEVAVASRDGTLQAITQDSGSDLPVGISLSADQRVALVNQLTLELAQSGQLPTGVTQTIDGDCGGSADVTSNSAGTSGQTDFDNFCTDDFDGQTIVNGRVDFTLTETSFTAVYRNVTITTEGETFTLNMTVDCDTSDDNYECTYSSDFTGSDGRVYRAANVIVSGDNDFGYDIYARVYDPDHGYVDIEAFGITVCSGGGIGSGTILVTDSTGTEVLDIDFSSCDAMSVTFNDVSEVYDQ